MAPARHSRRGRGLVVLVHQAEERGAPFTKGLRAAFTSTLVSFDFLFLVESDPEPTSNAIHLVGEVELASRLSYFLTGGGKQLPLIPPPSLQATLTNPGGPLRDLQPLRDHSLNELYDTYKTSATPAQKAFIDSRITSQKQVRNLSRDLLSLLAGIKDNSTNAQIIAAVTLIKMKVAPLVSLNIPLGADNHSDPGLALETSQTISGVASIAFLMQQLASRSPHVVHDVAPAAAYVPSAHGVQTAFAAGPLGPAQAAHVASHTVFAVTVHAEISYVPAPHTLHVTHVLSAR